MMINSLLNRISIALDRFRKDESGAALAEYGVLVALISVVSIGVVTLLGNQIFDAFTQVTTQLGTIDNIRTK